MTKFETLQAKQRLFSLATFGNTTLDRLTRNLNHIKSELLEINEQPSNIEEWADLLLIAIDSFWRTGGIALRIYNRELKEIASYYRDTLAIAEHIDHISQAIEMPEVYDMLIRMTVAAAYANGHEPHQLHDAALAKIEKNRRRAWTPIEQLAPGEPQQHKDLK